MDLYFMSPPPRDWSLQGRANFRSKHAAPVDPLRARREWLTLAEGIESLGGTVVVLPPVPGLSGLPYAAEAGHPLPPLRPGGAPRFLLPKMKPAHRVGERDVWGPFMRTLGFEVIDEPGAFVWEGQGDVAWFERATLLFYGGRTDVAGLHTMRKHFDGELIELSVREPAFHGNMALLALERSRSMLVCADVMHEDSLAMLEARVGRDCLHFVSEEEIQLYATNGLPVSDTVLCPSILPQRVRKLIEREGYKVAEMAMPELCEKAGGASRCLVCVFRDAPELAIPTENTLAAHRDDLLA
jgi:N-dimethylarginine dimethylaminohydrolase